MGGAAPASAPRGKKTRFTNWGFLPAHTAELGRLYSFQGKSENRNETKCKSQRGRGNTDMRRRGGTKSSTTWQPTQSSREGPSTITRPQAKRTRFLLSSDLKKKGNLELWSAKMGRAGSILMDLELAPRQPCLAGGRPPLPPHAPPEDLPALHTGFSVEQGKWGFQHGPLLAHRTRSICRAQLTPACTRRLGGGAWGSRCS